MMNNYIIKYDQMRLILNTCELRGIHNTVVLAITRHNTESKAISCEVYFGYQDYINKSQLNLEPTIAPLKSKTGNLKRQAETYANARCEVLCTLSLALEIINSFSEQNTKLKLEPRMIFEDNLRHSMVNALISSGILALAFDFNSSSILNKIAQSEKKDAQVITQERKSPTKTAFGSIQMNLSKEAGVLV